ncbi:hypothetical protein [Vibrio atypicus]|uniref:hypothetical protein n=1 Tax=Vibrio atypicus TaxID=558271 RepID=UPI00135841E3|nr:hypothetical protein [Vibrio atypicus]
MGRLLSVILIFISCNTIGSELIIKMQNREPIVLSHNDVLSHFEPTTFQTQLPWVDGKKSFTGFKATSLIDFLGVNDAFSLSFIALNDYAATSRIEDVIQYEPIVAYQMDGHHMKVRNKGPYWLIFNLDKYPEIDNAIFHSQMVWQIDQILIHRRSDGN